MSRDSELDQNLSGDIRKNFCADLNEIWYVGRGRWVMLDGMPYGRNQGQGHSREVDRQSPTGLIIYLFIYWNTVCIYGWAEFIGNRRSNIQTLHFMHQYRWLIICMSCVCNCRGAPLPDHSRVHEQVQRDARSTQRSTCWSVTWPSYLCCISQLWRG